ncbi:MAG TPA: cupin domain-containing protein [Sphingomicrobium sp.]|nr:cupin domain-containing protein [Sphingomicrobium sp.]
MTRLPTVVGRAAAFALVASPLFVSSAGATPGSGFTPSGIVSGQFGEIHLSRSNQAKNKDLKWGMTLTTTDDTDVGADRLTVAPSGTAGWHTHPSAVFVTVTSGSIVWTDGSDPQCPSTTYSAGQSFIEDAYVVHNVRNASDSVGAEFIAIHLNPTGTSGPSFRIDVPDVPDNCTF